ncbi:Hypothetical predicted protein, partial [Paramuricea clavata]
RNSSALVHFNPGNNTVRLDTTYETPVDDRNQSFWSHSGPYAMNPLENPCVVEKRMKVCLDPAFANPAYSNKDCMTGETSTSSQRTMNHYETICPVGVYERIDDGLRGRVQDAGARLKRNGHETRE